MQETQKEMQARLGAAQRRIFDALQFMRGPHGEVIYVGEQALQIAWHLARAGLDVDAERAIIKRRAIQPRLGQPPNLCDWVPITAADPDPEATAAQMVSAGDVDLDALEDALPWHSKTKFEGGFTQ